MCNACGIKDQAERRKAAKRPAEELTVTPVKSAKLGQDGSHHLLRAQTPNLPSILAALLPFGGMLTPARADVRADAADRSSSPASVPPAPATIDLSLGVPFDLFDIPLDLEEPQAPQLPNCPPTSSRVSLMRHMPQPHAGQFALLGKAPRMVAPSAQLQEAPGTQVIGCADHVLE